MLAKIVGSRLTVLSLQRWCVTSTHQGLFSILLAIAAQQAAWRAVRKACWSMEAEGRRAKTWDSAGHLWSSHHRIEPIHGVKGALLLNDTRPFECLEQLVEFNLLELEIKRILLLGAMAKVAVRKTTAWIVNRYRPRMDSCTESSVDCWYRIIRYAISNINSKNEFIHDY